MVEKKLFKTKLCLLYEKGSCSRQSCSFAHGDAELRRYSGSFNEFMEANKDQLSAWEVHLFLISYHHRGEICTFGRRDHRGSDLRDTLERRRSPERRYSPGRDVRGPRALHGRKQHHYDKGRSTSWSPSRSDKRQRKKQHLDGQSDISGSLKVSDGSDGIKERKIASSSAKYELEEKLKQVQMDVDKLDNHKNQLQIHLEQKVQEADHLVSRIEDLETQLNKEQEDSKRITSTIKKIIKVHNRYSKAQEELKRSQARLQKLGDYLVVNASRPNANDEDSSINFVSDGELNGETGLSPKNIRENRPSSNKKRQWISHEPSEEAKPANLRKHSVGASVSGRLSKFDVLATESDKNEKAADGLNQILVKGNGLRPITYEENKRRKHASLGMDPVEKVKGSEPGHTLPPTCMAAHAIDDLNEVLETEKTEVVEDATFKKSTPREKTRMPYLPPPPPLPAALRSAYKQYEGEDVEVDVEDLDMEVQDVDINNEVDIEQV